MENLGVLRPVDVQILVHQLILQTYRIINQLKCFEMFNYPDCFAVILSVNHNLIPLVPFLNHNLAPFNGTWMGVAKLLSVKGFACDVNLSWGLRHLLDLQKILSLRFDLSWWSWWNTWKPTTVQNFRPKRNMWQIDLCVATFWWNPGGFDIQIGCAVWIDWNLQVRKRRESNSFHIPEKMRTIHSF